MLIRPDSGRFAFHQNGAAFAALFLCLRTLAMLLKLSFPANCEIL